jgi:hypothetical protein
MVRDAPSRLSDCGNQPSFLEEPVKDLLRTVIAAVVGAVIAIAVVVGQPALAAQVDKAAAKNSVTSKSIKDGTIKTKDLNAEVAGPLAKASTALQSVPDNSVTTNKLVTGAVTNPKIADNAVTNTKIADNAVGSSKVADNSLQAVDIAVERGTTGIDWANLAAGTCTATVAIETGHVVTGDFFLVTEPAGIAGNIQFFGREDAGSPTAIDIVECNDGNGPFDAPVASYSWAVIDN